MVPITEVQEAETAVASRDEKIVLAQQQMETVSNQLKDMLEIRSGDPLYMSTIQPQDMAGPNQAFPDLPQALAVALKHRPDLLRQRVELDKLDIRLAYLENQRLPQIDLAASLAMNGLAGTETEVGTAAEQPLRRQLLRLLEQHGRRRRLQSWFVGLDMAHLSIWATAKPTAATAWPAGSASGPCTASSAWKAPPRPSSRTPWSPCAAAWSGCRWPIASKSLAETNPQAGECAAWTRG